MNKRTPLHSFKRSVTVMALGLAASLSLAAQASPPNHGFRGNLDFGVSRYEDYSYLRGHRLARRGHGYDRRFDDRHGAPHGGPTFLAGPHVEFGLSLYDVDHRSYDVGHIYRNGHAGRRRYH